MRAGLRAANIDIIAIDETPIIPIYTYEDNKTFLACKMLFDNGVYVNPVVSPATPVGQALLRTSYTATHTEAQMDKAIDKIVEVLKILEV
jgi:7-keto-8-aminopelargonate synthetase-like enzyme